MRTKSILLEVLLVTGLASSTSAQWQHGMLVDKIIACVDDQVILESELEKESQLLQAQPGVQPIKGKCQILQEILSNKMLLASASLEGITIEETVIESEVSQRMQEFLDEAGSEAVIEQITGKSIQLLKEELRKNIKERLIIIQMYQKIIGDFSITPQEVKTFFHQLPPDSVPYYAAEVEIRQIVRYPVLSQHDKAAIIDRLQSFKERIQAGEKFEQLAKQYSEDPCSARSGGELGFCNLGELVSAYETAVLTLKPGEISDPVETEFGFHLIQLIERQSGRYNSRHILIKPSASELAIQAAIAQLDSIRTLILEKHTTFEKAAQEYSEEPVTSQQEGLLTGGAGSLRMSVDDLAPEIFFAIDQLSPGAISQPMVFITPEGKQALRILCPKEKIAAHQANLVQDYETLQKMALSAKRSRALQEYLKSIKDSIFIKIIPDYQHCMKLL